MIPKQQIPSQNFFSNKTALLALSNGEVFWGTSVGVSSIVLGEVVFNTAMTGYQEILTDPSYANQIVCLTAPHIGNTGINEDDAESSQVWPKALIIREKPSFTSHYRATQNLYDYLLEKNIPCIAGIDTRCLTHLLRENGSKNACLMTGEHLDEKKAVHLACHFENEDVDLINGVSTKKVYSYPASGLAKQAFHVLVYDFGVKKSILQQLANQGCSVTVIPAMTSIKDMLALSPDGIVLSNGPGDPRHYGPLIKRIKQLMETNIPILGICLGHQLLALASGANVFKMKFGHHGANHPVQCLQTKKVFITSQNHNFAVDELTLPATLKITHRSLFDNTLQGMEYLHKPIISFQGHPEGSPGPTDIRSCFEKFISMMFCKMQQAVQVSSAVS